MPYRFRSGKRSGFPADGMRLRAADTISKRRGVSARRRSSAHPLVRVWRMSTTTRSGRERRSAVTVVVLLIACGSAQAGCADLPVQGDGVVAAIDDARSLRLDDGREIRLAGLEVAAAHAAATIAALTTLTRGRHVALHGADGTPDRYGRQPAYVVTDDAALPVQARLLQAGHAMVGLGIAQPDCRAELLAAEAAARDARLGLWAEPGALLQAADGDALLARAGRFTVVEGRIVSVREAGSMIFLNFGRRWTRDFAVTISRRILGSFEAAGISPKSLEYKRIRVRGWIERRTGPQIGIREVGQIEVPGAR
ncbi:thermonuclease family protein [Rhodopseudomonas sp. HC1]|uniref:thermonuclease family protein n=1 Tax=Rhodopseudomonas infernalis TaxID=2897386 RepID=UPI001EE81E87|nr:thermonuclease family protein [Rhodopseudomonas infernalis]MCG6206179.1 thermonuclease family protein [Rhodopseudomonas infernalis]